jgi:hypothetical protein
MNFNYTDFDAATTLLNLQSNKFYDALKRDQETSLQKLRQIRQESDLYRSNLMKEYPNLYSSKSLKTSSEETLLNLLQKQTTQ